jgi:hypothetical protein
MRTMSSGRCKGGLQWTSLPLVAILVGTSCGSLRSTGNTTDGGPGPDGVSIPTVNLDSRGPGPDGVSMPMVDLADELANDAAAVDLLPRCCSEGVQLSPVATDAPCSFTMPVSPPSEYRSYFVVYLNRDLVAPDTVDGGSGYFYDPTTLTVTFTGGLCDTIMSSPQDNVVYVLCNCKGPCPSWDWCP